MMRRSSAGRDDSAERNGRVSHNGNARRNGRAGGKVRVAIIGVGNCASSLVQGVTFYKDADPAADVPGLMHVDLGGYHVRDIEFVAAFDVNAAKVGRDLADAIKAEPNNTIQFAQVAPTGVIVQRGPTLDGIGKYLDDVVPESDAEPVDVERILRESGADVAVCYLPVGSQQAVEFYAQACMNAGVGFVNCIPVFIASNPAWRAKFEAAGVPIVGDDIKSQFGATISHRVLTHLFKQRGVKLERTYQLNFGGNTDFLNMLERERLESKKISKRNAVTSQLDYPISDDNAHIGPSDHVPWLLDRKFCYIRMEGTTFGNVPISCEMKLEVWDSPNSAGVVIDAVRCCKLALDRGIGGALFGPSSYFMKSPPQQCSDDEAHARTEAFIADEPGPTLPPRKLVTSNGSDAASGADGNGVHAENGKGAAKNGRSAASHGAGEPHARLADAKPSRAPSKHSRSTRLPGGALVGAKNAKLAQPE
jgi:myo-inositol-1-phosphate synthase